MRHTIKNKAGLRKIIKTLRNNSCKNIAIANDWSWELVDESENVRFCVYTVPVRFFLENYNYNTEKDIDDSISIGFRELEGAVRENTNINQKSEW